MANEQAPAGKIFQCLACGKISRWRYGFNPEGRQTNAQGRPYASYGWDESCMMNCALVEATETDVAHVDRLAPPV
jgi:hypothetical protein